MPQAIDWSASPQAVTTFTDGLLTYHSSSQQRDEKIVISLVRDNSLFVTEKKPFSSSFSEPRFVTDNVTSVSTGATARLGTLFASYDLLVDENREIFFYRDLLDFRQFHSWPEVVQVTQLQNNEQFPTIPDHTPNENIFVTYNAGPFPDDPNTRQYRLLTMLGTADVEENTVSVRTSSRALQSLFSEEEADLVFDGGVISDEILLKDKDVEVVSLTFSHTSLTPIFTWSSRIVGYNVVLRARASGVLRISLTEIRSGQPVEDVRITVLEERYRFVTQAKTDRRGEAFITGLSLNDIRNLFYRINLEHPLFPTVRLIVFIDPLSSVYSQKFLSIAGTDSEIKVNMLGGALFGRVKDAWSNLSLPETQLDLLHEDSEQVTREFTNEDGRYEIIDLEAGDYTLDVRKSGYRQMRASFRIEASEEFLYNFDLAGDPVTCGQAKTQEQLNVITPSYWNTEERAQNYILFLEAYAEVFCDMLRALERVVRDNYIATAREDALLSNFGTVLGIRPFGDTEAYRFMLASMMRIIQRGPNLDTIHDAIVLVLEAERRLSNTLVDRFGFQLGSDPERFRFRYGFRRTEQATVVDSSTIRLSRRPAFINEVHFYNSIKDVSQLPGGEFSRSLRLTVHSVEGKNIVLRDVDLLSGNVIFVDYGYINVTTYQTFDKSDEKLLNTRMGRYNDHYTVTGASLPVKFEPQIATSAVPFVVHKRTFHPFMKVQTQLFQIDIPIDFDYDFTFNGFRQGRKNLTQFIEILSLMIRRVTPAHVKPIVRLMRIDSEDFPVQRVQSSIIGRGGVDVQVVDEPVQT